MMEISTGTVISRLCRVSLIWLLLRRLPQSQQGTIIQFELDEVIWLVPSHPPLYVMFSSPLTWWSHTCIPPPAPLRCSSIKELFAAPPSPNAEGCCVHRCSLYSAGAEMHHLKSWTKIWMSACGQSVGPIWLFFFFSLPLYTCSCKLHDYAAQGQSRLCSGTSNASVGDKVKCSPVHVVSCKMPAAGLTFECPRTNHCLQTCWQFLEVEVEGHTQCNHLLWAAGNFLPADRGGGYTEGGPAACFGPASSRRAGVFSPDCGESWRVERRLLRSACCE